jgi:hypothetical protein
VEHRLHHRRGQLRRAFPRRLRSPQRRQCWRNVRHCDLDTVQCAAVAVDGRSAVCRAIGACDIEPVVRRPEVRRLRLGLLCADGGQEALQLHLGWPLLPLERASGCCADSHFCRHHRRRRRSRQPLRCRYRKARPERPDGRDARHGNALSRGRAYRDHGGSCRGKGVRPQAAYACLVPHAFGSSQAPTRGPYPRARWVCGGAALLEKWRPG